MDETYDETTRYYPGPNIVMSAREHSDGGYVLVSMKYEPNAAADEFTGIWTEATSVREVLEHSGFSACYGEEPFVEISKQGYDFELIEDLAGMLMDYEGMNLYVVCRRENLGSK